MTRAGAGDSRLAANYMCCGQRQVLATESQKQQPARRRALRECLGCGKALLHQRVQNERSVLDSDTAQRRRCSLPCERLRLA